MYQAGRLFYVLLFFFITVLTAGCSRQPSYEHPPISDDNIVLDIAALPFETPKFYTYLYQEKPISFFVLRLNTGVSAFLDACTTCYPHKRGYAYKDGRVTCRECSMNFSIYKLEQGMGGCFPIKIQGKTEGSKYIIPLSVLEAEAHKF